MPVARPAVWVVLAVTAMAIVVWVVAAGQAGDAATGGAVSGTAGREAVQDDASEGPLDCRVVAGSLVCTDPKSGTGSAAPTPSTNPSASHSQGFTLPYPIPSSSQTLDSIPEDIVGEEGEVPFHCGDPGEIPCQQE